MGGIWPLLVTGGKLLIVTSRLQWLLLTAMALNEYMVDAGLISLDEKAEGASPKVIRDAGF